jgi:hypothetical protein
MAKSRRAGLRRTGEGLIVQPVENRARVRVRVVEPLQPPSGYSGAAWSVQVLEAQPVGDWPNLVSGQIGNTPRLFVPADVLAAISGRGGSAGLPEEPSLASGLGREAAPQAQEWELVVELAGPGTLRARPLPEQPEQPEQPGQVGTTPA